MLQCATQEGNVPFCVRDLGQPLPDSQVSTNQGESAKAQKEAIVAKKMTAREFWAVTNLVDPSKTGPEAELSPGGLWWPTWAGNNNICPITGADDILIVEGDSILLHQETGGHDDLLMWLNKEEDGAFVFTPCVGGPDGDDGEQAWTCDEVLVIEAHQIPRCVSCTKRAEAFFKEQEEKRKEAKKNLHPGKSDTWLYVVYTNGPDPEDEGAPVFVTIHKQKASAEAFAEKYRAVHKDEVVFVRREPLFE